MIRTLSVGLLATGLLTAALPVAANDFAPGAPPSAGPSVVIEPFVGYLRGTATENVYDPISKQKISQLDWNVQAVTVGGRLSVRPMDGLTVRARAWTAVNGDADMTDRDWLGGYYGRSSWTHKSQHPETEVPKAWQGDISASFTLVEAGDVALTGIAGYRHYNVKYRANGGSYIYSGGGFRTLQGQFNSGQLGISYEQWWDTPYLGLGAYWRGENFALSTEIYGSPVSYSRDRDYHALRYTVFKENFSPLGMVGASLGLEYNFSQTFALAGRLDYTRYSEQKGGTTMIDGTTGEVYRFKKPSAGADADTLLLSLGIKAKL